MTEERKADQNSDDDDVQMHVPGAQAPPPPRGAAPRSSALKIKLPPRQGEQQPAAHGQQAAESAAHGQKRKLEERSDEDKRNVRLKTETAKESKALIAAEAREKQASKDADAMNQVLMYASGYKSTDVTHYVEQGCRRFLKALSEARHESALEFMALYGVEPWKDHKRKFVAIGERAAGFAAGELQAGGIGRVGDWLLAGGVRMSTALPPTSSRRDQAAAEFGAPPWDLVVWQVDALDLLKQYDNVRVAAGRAGRNQPAPVDIGHIERAIKVASIAGAQGDHQKPLTGSRLNGVLAGMYHGAVYGTRVLFAIHYGYMQTRPRAKYIRPVTEWLQSMGSDAVDLDELPKYLLKRFVIKEQLVRGGMESTAESLQSAGELGYSGNITSLIAQYAGVSGRCHVCERKTKTAYCSTQCKATAAARRGY